MRGTEARHKTEAAGAEFFDDVPESGKVRTAVIEAPCRAG